MDRIIISTPAGPVSALQCGAGDRLHFAHATGMNAQVYARLLAPLPGSFAVTASDARGHGLTGLSKDPAALNSWDDFASDLNNLLDVIDGGARWLLAGHSMGAAVSLLAAALRPERVAGLVLIDPAMLPFDVAALVRAGQAIPNPMADQAAKRRGVFPSRADARAAYHGRGVFRSWADADLDAYLAGGMVDTAQAAELAAFAAHPACLRAVRVAGTTHFLPLERPELVRDAIIEVSSSAAAR